MFSTCLEKKQANTAAFAHSVLPNHAFPGDGVSSNSRIKVIKNDDLVSVGDGVNDIVDILLELVFSLIWVGQGRSINTDNDCKLSSSEG